MTRRIVGLFDTREEAQQVQQDLLREGFTPAEIHLVSKATGGQAAGHDEGGFWEAVRDFFGWEDTTDYEEATRRGGTLVSVDVPEDKVEAVMAVMNRHHPVDIDRKVEEWTRAGWQRPTAAAAGATPARAGTARKGEAVIPVVQEQLEVGKRREQRGGVRIYTRVTEKPVQQDVHLREEHVNVERRPADRPASPDAFRERTIEATETREVPVVSKEARVVEEVAVNKDVRQRTETVKDTVRRTDVDVERLDDDFRKDFETGFANQGYTYEQFRPAFEYGHRLGMDERYQGRDWTVIEPEARREFEKVHPGAWERFKEAVHRAFDRARGHSHSHA